MSANGRALAWMLVLAAYLIAAAAAVGTGYGVRSLPPLAVAGVAGLAATLVVFGSSLLADNSSMYDPYWSVWPPLVAVYFAAVGDPAVPSLRRWLVLVLVFAWGVRLTAHWAARWRGLGHEDWRYVRFRARFGRAYWVVSLMGVHLFPSVQTYLGVVPVYVALAVGTRAFGPLDVVAAVVTAGAIAVETVADAQLRRFRRIRGDEAVSDRGLWAWSRHPNYFGEVSFWWGLWLFGLAADPRWWWSGIGAVAITAMVVVASIPMMERRNEERRPGYAEARAGVPSLVPRPPRDPAARRRPR